MDTINFIALLSLTWLFTEGATPVQFLKKLFNVHADAETAKLSLTKKVVQGLINCALCSGFWIGLIYYQNLLMACLVSVGAELFARAIKLIFSKYLNSL
jgi:type III secretory pathway component EscU